MTGVTLRLSFRRAEQIMRHQTYLCAGALAVAASLGLHSSASAAGGQLRCKDVTQTLVIDGKPQKAVMPMCQRADGTWELAQSSETQNTYQIPPLPPALPQPNAGYAQYSDNTPSYPAYAPYDYQANPPYYGGGYPWSYYDGWGGPGYVSFGFGSWGGWDRGGWGGHGFGGFHGGGRR